MNLAGTSIVMLSTALVWSLSFLLARPLLAWNWRPGWQGRLKREEVLRLVVRKGGDPEIEVWLAETPGRPAELWRNCPRGDWLFSLASEAGVERALLVRAACACAREALAAVGTVDPRARRALEVAEAWARGEASLPDLLAAESGAWAAVAVTRGPERLAAIAAAGAAASGDRWRHGTGPLVAAAEVAAALSGGGEPAEQARAASLARSAQLVRLLIPWGQVDTEFLSSLEPGSVQPGC
jgi:hypothetical protein